MSKFKNCFLKYFFITISFFSVIIFFSCRSTAFENENFIDSSLETFDTSDIQIHQDDDVFVLYNQDEFFYETQSSAKNSTQSLNQNSVKNASQNSIESSTQKITQNSTQKNDNYIFLRLYQVSYKNKGSIENLLGKAIRSFDVNKESFSHSAIGFDLEEPFYGLTIASKKKLKLESCTNTITNPYMEKCNKIKSVQVTYALKVSEEEYNNAKAMVEKYYNDPKTRYDSVQNIVIGFSTALREKNPKKATDHFIKTKQAKYIYNDKKNNFVCSTIIAYILENSVESVKQFFEENQFDTDFVFPSDIPFIPGVTRLYSSTWIDCDIATDLYLEKYPILK